MAPAALLHPSPGDRVLDLCAAPGGKATQLADFLNGKGLLVCNEIHPKRAKILSRNIERMGIANALVLNMHPRDLETLFINFFDKILVDAPCSGEGMFRKEAASVTDWSPETVLMCAARQKEILRSAAAMLRPGGTLCYSTCTFSPEENEGVMAWFLEEYQEFSPVETEAPWFAPAHPEWAKPENPQSSVTDFGCGRTSWLEKDILLCFYRNRTTEILFILTAGIFASIKAPKELRSFLTELNIQLPNGQLVSFGSSLYLLPPEAPDLNRLKVLRPGLELGVLKKGRFEPSHALAIWLRSCEQIADFPADSPEILDYLHGQVLHGNHKGWTLVTVDRLSLGWAKGADGQLKNHFPKGLRWV